MNYNVRRGTWSYNDELTTAIVWEKANRTAEADGVDASYVQLFATDNLLTTHYYIITMRNIQNIRNILTWNSRGSARELLYKCGWAPQMCICN
jgi:hypothetical protein